MSYCNTIQGPPSGFGYCRSLVRIQLPRPRITLIILDYRAVKLTVAIAFGLQIATGSPRRE